jgi:hypothetical protein
MITVFARAVMSAAAVHMPQDGDGTAPLLADNGGRFAGATGRADRSGFHQGIDHG